MKWILKSKKTGLYWSKELGEWTRDETKATVFFNPPYVMKSKEEAVRIL